MQMLLRHFQLGLIGGRVGNGAAKISIGDEIPKQGAMGHGDVSFVMNGRADLYHAQIFGIVYLGRFAMH